MFKRLKDRFNSLSRTIRAGYYKPITGVEDIDPDSTSTQLPHKRLVTVGMGALTVAYAVVTDVFLNIVEAASTTVVSLGAGALAITGLGVLGHIYNKCKKACQDVITEVNAAGQTVRGTRKDLYMLHQAQKKIFSLTSEFEEAAPMFVIQKEVDTVIDKMEETRKRVTVLDKKGVVQPDQEYKFKRIIIDFADAVSRHNPSPNAPTHKVKQMRAHGMAA